jgi:predicted alpha/beta-hydrolase family hydrolase
VTIAKVPEQELSGCAQASSSITAAAHKLARIFYAVMKFEMAYLKQDAEAYEAEQRAKREQNLHRRVKELGYEVKKIEPKTPETGEASSP